MSFPFALAYRTPINALPEIQLVFGKLKVCRKISAQPDIFYDLLESVFRATVNRLTFGPENSLARR